MTLRAGLAGLLMLLAVPAHAAPVAFVTAVSYTYAPGDVETPEAPLTVDRGGRLLYSNVDAMGYHSIVSYDLDERGAPLFSAPLAGTGEVHEVAGVPALAPGSYRFYCDAHGTVMEGTLTIT